MGAVAAMAAGMWRAPRPLQRWIGVAFDLSVFAFAFKVWNDGAQLIDAATMAPVTAFAGSAVGWFWLFMMALFTDRRSVRAAHFAPVAALFVLGMGGFGAPEPWQDLVWAVRNVLQLGLAAHALFVVLRGWKGDLVEARRRMRGPFLGVVGLYILVQRTLELLAMGGMAPPWYELFSVASLAFICVFGAFVFLDARVALFGEAAAAPAPLTAAPGASPPSVAGALPALDRAGRADLDRVAKLMTLDEVWREEGLTIASLSLKASVPETQLRRLINDHLSYRNFPSFVNAHRIAAARRRLSDPHEARVSISTIAFDIGFGSLGPFNRAFREATGKSPSEWRREALGSAADSAGEAPAEGSPISRSA
jgi:AraC-like DNA-binding protein